MSKVFLAVLFAFAGSLHARERVFVGSYNQDSLLPGIYVFELDTATGDLHSICEIRNVLNPAYLSISPGGDHVYACTEARVPGRGKIASYFFRNDTLTFLNEVSSGGENPVYISLHKGQRNMVAANYTGGSVAFFPVSGDGSVSSAAWIQQLTGSSVNLERQESAHPHAAVFSPDFTHLFVPDLGTDEIRIYKFDTAQRRLQPATSVQMTKGSGPRHFVFRPDGKYAYCTEEMAGAVTVFRYDGIARLDSVQRVFLHEGHRKKATYSSADVHCSADGLFLYASNRGDENNIAIYSVDAQSGRLTWEGFCSVEGNHPRTFVIDPSGNFLLVSNQVSGNVTVFRRNRVNGLLQYTGKQAKVPGASCVKMYNYKDD